MEGILSRVSCRDVCSFVGFVWTLVFITTLSIKYSLVATVFAVTNALLLIYWFSLPPPDPEQVQTFISSLAIGAHRGLGLDAPENTIFAIRKAKELGADSVEFDLEFTADGVPVLLHDDTVDRTTDGSGSISQLTWAEVQNLNAAAKFTNQSEFPVARIPRLEEAIEVCLDLDLRIFIDVKCFSKLSLLTTTLSSLFRQHPDLYERAAVCSFFPQVVYEVKKADPKILTGHTFRPGFFAYSDIDMTEKRFGSSLPQHWLASILDSLNIWALHNVYWKFTGASLILAQQRCISDNYAREWKSRGLQVVSWTSNDKFEKLHFLMDLKVPFLTDSLADIQNEIEDLKLEKNEG